MAQNIITQIIKTTWKDLRCISSQIMVTIETGHFIQFKIAK